MSQEGRTVYYEYKGHLIINHRFFDGLLQRFAGCGIRENAEGQKIIVSLTSFPQRMDILPYTLYSLFIQSAKPDKIILWLAREQFPNGLDDVPPSVKKFCDFGLTISFTEDLKSYKKLVPALFAYPDDVLVTADDDIFYPEDWLEKLLKEAEKSPQAIIAHRVRKVAFAENGSLAPYAEWRLCEDNSLSFFNLGTSGGGMLFPPRSLHPDVLKKEVFLQAAPTSDDIWFWFMALLNGRKIKQVKNGCVRLIETYRSKDYNDVNFYMLSTVNRTGNDACTANLLSLYPEVLQFLQKNREVFSSAEYWKNRYDRGGNSGTGSYSRVAEYKVQVINAFIAEKGIACAAEFGCGDGNVAQSFKIDRYTGFDVSDTAVSLCRAKKLPRKLFYSVTEYQNETYELALSLDVLFHLVEDHVFERYMDTLFAAAEKYVCIYASNLDEQPKDSIHVRHRHFTPYIEENFPEWKLVQCLDNPFYDENVTFSRFYFYEKQA